jgi:hypothetical protein
MKTITRLFFLLFCLAFSSSILAEDDDFKLFKKNKVNEQIFIRYLQDSLWQVKTAYNAAHFLMIPLHYASIEEHKGLSNAFRKHFEKLLATHKIQPFQLKELDDLQYLSLASRYLALDMPEKHDDLKQELAEYVEKRFLYWWKENPAWQWARESFKGGISERIAFKLTHSDKRKSYYSVLLDVDFYAIGIAADLYTYYKKQGKECQECQEAFRLFSVVMKTRFDYNHQGWVFQKDFWLEHPDYLYSGYYVRPPANAKHVTAKSIQEDASHGHRWPLWLVQIQQVMDVSDLIKRLRWQMLHVIIDEHQSMDAPLLNNYMCGHNGYYRFNYEGTGFRGHGPYELSGTFSLGWWSLLGGEQLAQHYSNLANAYPLNPALEQFYREFTLTKDYPLSDTLNDNGMRVNLARMSTIVAKHIGDK